MQARVSLSLIAKNEEANLPACLESVAGLVDEIMVVDTGSTDRTKEVAAGLGARVFDFAWCDSFSAARNESLRHATGDWIFWLDGDERLDAANRAKFQALRGGLNGQAMAFVMKQCSVPDAHGSSPTEVDQVRLFRNHPAVRWSYRVHEQILPALRRAGHAVRFTDIAITHTGYQDRVVQRHKTERNLRLLHLEYREQPDDPFTLFNLGWGLHELGQVEQALPLLRQPELAVALRSVSVLAYPNSYPETSCIAVLEAMAAGCLVVISRRGALAETIAGFGRLVPPDDDRPTYVDQFVQATVPALTDLTGPETSALESKLVEQVAHVRQTHTWPVLAEQWSGWLARLRAARG